MTRLDQFARHVAQSGTVMAEDIAELRRAIYQDGVVSRQEGEALFEIERARTAHSDAWSELFVEALTDYAIKQEPPEGYLSEDTTTWITGEISKRKTPSTDAKVELVINIIEKAREIAFRWETETYRADALGMLSAVFANWRKAGDKDFIADTLRNNRTLAQDLEHRFEQENAAYDAAQLAASVMTPDKAGWLLDHIDQNGLMTEPEKALVRFIRREASVLDPSLTKVLEKAE